MDEFMPLAEVPAVNVPATTVDHREVAPFPRFRVLALQDDRICLVIKLDLDAREVWFYQAIGASPAMFRRKEGFGSLYWLGLRDSTGAYLDGARSYSLAVPLPVPAKLFWSVTVYDAETRSEIQTEQGKAALRSLFELQTSAQDQSVDLHFGPSAPPGAEGRWIKTLPGRGWFAYFRLYGPQQPAFDDAINAAVAWMQSVVR